MNQDQLLAFIKKVAVSTEITKSGITYYVMPKDFDPTAAQIKYFAFCMFLPNRTIGISEEVPESFRDLWVDHEAECVPTEYKDCAEISSADIRIAKRTFLRREYGLFLRMRKDLYETAIEFQPNHAHIAEMQEALNLYMIALLQSN